MYVLAPKHEASTTIQHRAKASALSSLPSFCPQIYPVDPVGMAFLVESYSV